MAVPPPDEAQLVAFGKGLDAAIREVAQCLYKGWHGSTDIDEYPSDVDWCGAAMVVLVQQYEWDIDDPETAKLANTLHSRYTGEDT